MYGNKTYQEPLLGTERFKKVYNYDVGSNYASQGQTHLVQIYSDKISEGPRIIAEDNPDGVPLIIMPENYPGCCCCLCLGHKYKCWHWKLNVPDGLYTLE